MFLALTRPEQHDYQPLPGNIASLPSSETVVTDAFRGMVFVDFIEAAREGGLHVGLGDASYAIWIGSSATAGCTTGPGEGVTTGVGEGLRDGAVNDMSGMTVSGEDSGPGFLFHVFGRGNPGNPFPFCVMG